MRILVIDDDRDMGKMTCRLLQVFGHEARSDFSGAAGISTAFAWNPDMILLDILMQEMDGIEALKELRRQGYRGRIAMMSTYNDPEVIRNAQANGADFYLYKGSRHLDEDIKRLLSTL